MKIHLLVAAAATAVTLTAGCGQLANTPGAPSKGTAGVTAQTTIHKPAPAGAEKKAEAGLESLWGGTLGAQSISITLTPGSWVQLSIGRADFNGTTFGSSVSGSLRHKGVTESVYINGFSSSIQGRIGRDSVIASIAPGGWVSGRVGDKRLNLSVSRTVITGDIDGNRLWLSGTGLDPREDLGMTAALMVLAAAAD